MHCGALERHRLAWAFLQKETDLFDGSNKEVLHFAPEKCFEPRLRAAFGDNYVTTDLLRQDVDVNIDVTDIQHSDATFDVIICSHVLEHVPDDASAMRELARILKDDGWTLLMVPIKGKQTVEDPSIVTPEERKKAFGQWDHVRWYGTDIVDRLDAAGFDVTPVRREAIFAPKEYRRNGLLVNRTLFYCKKAAA